MEPQPEHQIRGLGPIMISIPTGQQPDLVLPRALGMREVRDYPTPANEGSAATPRRSSTLLSSPISL